MKWLYEDMDRLKQVIRFKDRVEFRYKGELHNTKGPAWVGIIDNQKTGTNKYYINGNHLEHREWLIKIRPLKLKKLLKKNS